VKTLGAKTLAAAIGASVVVSALLLPSQTAIASPGRPAQFGPGHQAKKVLKAPMHGKAALQALGGNLGTAAAINGRTPGNLKQLLTSDPTMWLDQNGRLFVREEWSAPAGGTSAPPTTAASSPFPLSQTFNLHSNPGSKRIIYLDFVGATISSDYWTQAASVPAGTYAPWSLDSSTGFSTTEEQDIQEIWARIAEHYAAFDVDVTTQAPSEDALVRTSASDQSYGVRLLFSGGALANSSGYASSDTARTDICGGACGGVASVGTLSQPTDTSQGITGEFFNVAWVFTNELGPNYPKAIADAAAHEAGHTFGLTHDGTTTDPNCVGQPIGCSYYAGNSLWGPLMGDPYDSAVSQWSKGEYTNANNPQDDLAVIEEQAPPRISSSGSAIASAVALSSNGQAGFITGANNQNYYDLGTCSGTVTVSGSPAALGPDLDVNLSLLDSNGTVVASNDAADTSDGAMPPVASGMGASISTSVASGHYYLAISGGGSGANGANDPTNGFSNYASMGAYSLSAASGCTPPTTAPGLATELQVGTSCSGQEITWNPPADSGNSAITRYLVSVDNGTWTSVGTARSAYFKGLGSGHTYSVKAVNAAGTGPASSLTIPGPVSGVTATYQGTATQGSQTVDQYQVTWTAPASSAAGGLPIGGYHLVMGSNTATVYEPGVTVYVSQGYHPTMTVAATNASGLGTGTDVVLQNGATGSADAPPTPATYTGTPTSYCPAVPSVPRSVRLVRGASGGALTTTGSWVKPSSGQPTSFTYSVRVDTRNRAGKIVATHYYSTSHTSLVVKGSSGYTYRIRVRAHNTTGWGTWSGYTGWVAPR
jgi:hypothetical protein